MKPIAAVRDDAPRLPQDWLELMRFLSGYYQRPLGETVIGALPPRLRSVKPLPKQSAAARRRPRASPRFVAEPCADRRRRREAVERIAAALGRFQPFLLHGVTGSGKTEVYLHLIAEVAASAASRRWCWFPRSA